MTAKSDDMFRPLSVGDWLHNPVTGEIARLAVAPSETGGRSLEAELWLQPGAAVLGQHTHSALNETFEVQAGRLAYELDGVAGNAGPGEAAQIPVGVAHDWWNAGDEPVQIRVQVESVDGGPPMAGRFLSMIEFAWSMAASGLTNDKGVPGVLWLAAMATEYSDVLQLTSPPPPVQRVVFGPLGLIARMRNRDPLTPDLHGYRSPAYIEEPDQPTLDRMLSVKASAGSSRWQAGHQPS